jgi:hypothetical protein
MSQHAFLLTACFILALVDEEQIRRALDICGISITKLAVYWDRDRSYVERQLKDERPFPHRDLAKLPLKFMQWYCALLLMKIGLPEELRQAAVIDTAIRDYEHQLMLFEQSERKERAS